jgi:HlyD family secretion protein
MRTGIVIAGAVIVALGAWIYSAWFSGVAVEAAACHRGAIDEYVEEEAKTRLAETYLITMPYDARIEPIDLVEGTKVSKGQVVAQVKPIDLALNREAAIAAVNRLKASIRENDDTTVESTTLRQTLSLAESVDRMVDSAAERVKSGQVKLEYAEKDLNRIERLVASNASAQRELDQARVSRVDSNVQYQQDLLVLRSAEAIQTAATLLPTAVRQYIQRKVLAHDVLEQQLAEAEIRVRETDKNANRGAMTSPVDGIVLERAVSNERQVTAGTVLLRIGRWEDLEIEADILSQDVVRVKPGQTVEVHGAAIGQQPATAIVSRIYPAGFTKVSSLGVEQQRVKVILQLASQDLRRLRENNDLGVDYRVRVRIFTARATDALIVPRSALFRGPKNDWRLFAVRGGRARLVTVKIGLGNDEKVQILSGLAEGDQVILAPETNLADGQRVQVLAMEPAEAS